jgi:hypothetical protein
MTGSHNTCFALVQEEYLKKRDEKSLGEMYRISVELASNYIRKYARNRYLRLNVAELAHDSTANLIARYIDKTDFRVEPLSAYLFRCCNTTMWRDKEWNKRKVSFEDWMRATGELAE